MYKNSWAYRCTHCGYFVNDTADQLHSEICGKTFKCEKCSQTIPLMEKEDHMACHQLEAEVGDIDLREGEKVEEVNFKKQPKKERNNVEKEPISFEINFKEEPKPKENKVEEQISEEINCKEEQNNFQERPKNIPWLVGDEKPLFKKENSKEDKNEEMQNQIKSLMDTFRRRKKPEQHEIKKTISQNYEKSNMINDRKMLYVEKLPDINFAQKEQNNDSNNACLEELIREQRIKKFSSSDKVLGNEKSSLLHNSIPLSQPQQQSQSQKDLKSENIKKDNDLSASLIKQFSQPQVYTINDIKSVPEGECNICLEDFNLGTEIVILPCFHIYHIQCFRDWIEQNKKECPFCKFVFTLPDNF